jgi:hypothetical protein
VTRVREDELGYRLAEDWRTISISHILEFQDIDSKANGSRRRRK